MLHETIENTSLCYGRLNRIVIRTKTKSFPVDADVNYLNTERYSRTSIL